MRFMPAATAFLTVLAPALAQQPQNAKSDPSQQPSFRDRAQKCQELLEKEREAIEARQQRIEAELKDLDRDKLPKEHWARDWAGEYYQGDGLGANILFRLAPESGFSYTWHGCMGLYDGNHGDIAEVFPDGLRLKLAIPADLSTFETVSDRLYFVPWGEERFLVPECLLMKFVNNYNEGGFARAEMYHIPRLIRDKNYHGFRSAPPGLPKLPDKYAKLLRTKPITLTVAKVDAKPPKHVTGEVHSHAFDVVLEGGATAGAFVGMEFSIGQGLNMGVLTLTEVGETTSRGRAQFFNTGSSSQDLIRVGQTINSERPDPVPPQPPAKP
jgi:hypothetical protein